MFPNIVVDIGNSRMKWGRCDADGVVAMATLPPDDVAAWEEQLQQWQLPANFRWAAASVHPERTEVFANWVRQRGDLICTIESSKQLPLQTHLKEPDKAGIDRLLNAVAANSRRKVNTPAVIVDAGSAVTVDLLDESGSFRGGAIFPGLRLMAKALHDYTALLPTVEITRPPPALGQDTVAAMGSGIFRAVVGGIIQLASRDLCGREVQVFLTGGDALVFADELRRSFAVELWQEMTLEGIRLAGVHALA